MTANSIPCPYCGGRCTLRDSIEIYKSRSYGMSYICERYPECDTYVGVHRDTNNPLGTPANADVRKWRNRAHAAFDPLWKGGFLRRKAAYRFLQELLGIPEEKAHIAMFDVETCRNLIHQLGILKDLLPSIKTPEKDVDI